jgi:hypothetical protein
MSSATQLLWICMATLVTGALIWFAVLAIRWAKKGTTAGAMLAAAAFPFPDQPPPHEQVEEANRLDKHDEAGEPQE